MSSSDESGQPWELLVSVTRGGPSTLGRQVEDQLRNAIRDGSLRAGSVLPSTRDLARQLAVSRRVVVHAYAQLASGGFVSLRQGARPRVAAGARSQRGLEPTARPVAAAKGPALRQFDFRPSVPDVSQFPRTAWLRSLRHALASMTDADLGYGDPRGVESLRNAIADYVGRVRGVVADPEHVVVTNGYTQSLGLICRALAAGGATRIALEDPGNPEDAIIAARAGLEPVPVVVDDAGIRVDELTTARADAVVVTPAHQHPTGVVLTGGRRIALLEWLRMNNTIAIEDDYDAEYRYDREAIGALQGLDPSRVIYAGSTSKTLAPALRLGWLVVPARLLDAVVEEKFIADRGTARIEQHALADFLARGELDRHLRRMRMRYRASRDALVQALTAELPEVTLEGAAAGLHIAVRLPDGDHEVAVQKKAFRRGVEIEVMSEYRSDNLDRTPVLLLGYAQISLHAIRAGVHELALAVRAARRQARHDSKDGRPPRPAT